jgi:hypothetical protein
MSEQQEHEKTRMSLSELRSDTREANFQQAVMWRHRCRVNGATLRDISRDAMWEHVDDLIECATAWRGQYLSMIDKKGKEV